MVFILAQIIYYSLDPVLQLAPYVGAYCIIDDFKQIIYTPIEEKPNLHLHIMDKPIITTVCVVGLVLLRNVAFTIITT